MECLPGAKFDKIALKFMATRSYEKKYDLLILVGGINNITRTEYQPVKHATLQYVNRDRMLNTILNCLSREVQKIVGISSIPIVIATIPGMDLIKYSPQVWYRLLPLQTLLDSSMVEINRMIRGLNHMKVLDTPNLAYTIHRCAGHGGKYYAHYALLWDGLHPSTILLKKWANEIVRFCAGRLDGVHHVQHWVMNKW